MYLVGTVRNTYLAESVEKGDVLVELRAAFPVSRTETNEKIARSYVVGTLTDKVSDITLNSQNIESIQDATEITPLVELMMRYVPLAERQAKANMVLAELGKLMTTVEAQKKNE